MDGFVPFNGREVMLLNFNKFLNAYLKKIRDLRFLEFIFLCFSWYGGLTRDFYKFDKFRETKQNTALRLFFFAVC